MNIDNAKKLRLITCGGWNIDGIRIQIIDNNFAIIYYDRYMTNHQLQKKIIYLNPIEKYFKKITIEEKLEKEYKRLVGRLEAENEVILQRAKFCNKLVGLSDEPETSPPVDETGSVKHK